jgi:hypothetical protein
MADKKISALTGASTPLAGTEVLPIVQSGATVKVAVSDLTAGRAISATQVTVSTGNVIIGTSGQGIDFSATPGTGTSELLADYEEGTWTPTLSGFTTSGTVTATGNYRKVGTIMYIRAQVAVSGGTTTSVAGTSYFTNLPFSASNAGGCNTNNASTGIGYGVGSIQGNFIYPASWAATANTIVIDGTVTVA